MEKRKRKHCKESCTYTRYCAWRRYCCQSVITDRAVCNFYIYVDTKRKDQVSMRGSVNSVMIQSQNEASTVLQLNVFTTNYNVMKPLQCICYFQPTIFGEQCERTVFYVGLLSTPSK